MLHKANCQWTSIASYLTQKKYFVFSNDIDCEKYSDGFVQNNGGVKTTANFLNCSEQGSYITLTNTYSIAYYFKYQQFENQMFFVTFDLILFGEWNELDQVTYSINSKEYSWIYNNSIQKVQIANGVCNSQSAFIQTINFTINQTSIKGQHQFKAISISGDASIKNFIYSALICHPNCKTCWGSQPDQCSECFQGQVQFDNTCLNKCPPERPYFVKQQGCKIICPMDQLFYINGYCEKYNRNNYLLLGLQEQKTKEQYNWQILYDFKDLSLPIPRNFYYDTYYLLGLFKMNQGIYRVVNLINTYKLTLIYLQLVLFNKMPTGSSIELLINDTYFAKIYENNTVIETDKFIIYRTFQTSVYSDGTQSYQYNNYYQIYLETTLSGYFTLKLIGNYINSNAGWAIRTIEISSGYCPSQCKQCSEKFKCLQCNNNYYLTKWTQCTPCNNQNQILIDGYCQDFDHSDATINSQLLVKEFVGLDINPETYSQYVLNSFQGQNFLKGDQIYYSVYNNSQRIFGGPFIWAQARFSRQFNNLAAHHSFTIAFVVVFGPKFQENGKFILYIDDQFTKELNTSNGLEQKIFEKYVHNYNILKIDWECQGLQNEPIEAYCGFYQFYLTIHYCIKDCLNCDQTRCLDDTPTIQQSQCTNLNQYYDVYLTECVNCPINCQVCSSFQNCLQCKDRFENSSLGCICNNNNFLDKQQQTCIQCPTNCKQCINDQVCTECEIDKYRILINSQCICIDGYFENNGDCKICIQFCKKCNQQNDCQQCFQGYEFDNISISCKLSGNQYYVQGLDILLGCDQKNGCDPCNLNYSNCKCGDGMITDIEECDDSNIIKNDGCFECKLECQSECTKCVRGICYECGIIGWYLDIQMDNKYICKEQCKDGIKLGKEKCDDNIESTKLIYCQKCDFDQGKCLECRDGLVAKSNYCINNCGDGIIVSAPDKNIQEQCDDNNQVENDGCSSSCKFSCQSSLICNKCIDNICYNCVNTYRLNPKLHRCECTESCLNCDFINGNGCLQCQIGYELRDKQCYTICGDQIVTSHEQCDDANLIHDDGCHFCQYNCQHSCAFCIQGRCLKCLPNYSLLLSKCYYLPQQQNIFHYQIHNYYYNPSHLQLLFYQPFEYNMFQKVIQLQSLGLNNIKQMQLLKLIYFNYFESTLSFGLNNLQQNDDQIINYLKLQQDVIIYTTCFENDIECSLEFCLSCSQSNCQTLTKNNREQNCHQICGDGIVSKDEECDYQIQNYDKICTNCKYNCPLNCQLCHQGICIKCYQGFNLDLIYNSCNSICGDKLITIQEICDDGNNIIYDGCTQCQFQCQETCTNCYYGKCLSCQSSLFFDQKKGTCLDKKLCNESNGLYYNDLTNSCFTICGDQIKALDEQCDDGNQLRYDGCYQCQFECEQLCLICTNGKCTQCIDGYIIQNQICINQCGDGLVLTSEQCDDGNIVSRDGCTQCIIDPGYKCIIIQNQSFCFTCTSNCNYCTYFNNQIICNSCIKGYFLLGNDCIKCSESCLECEKTPNNCTSCKIQKCEKCQNDLGLYPNYNLQKCVSKCGDLIKASDEQCDDGNNQTGDGCNSLCQIEKGYECVKNICSKIPDKKVIANFSNKTTINNNLELIGEIDFFNICSQIQIKIDYFNSTEFNYTLKSFLINQTSLSGCYLDFQFYKTITEINLIHLLIPKSINSSRFLDEIQDIVIIPRKQIFYNQNQQAQAQQIATASNQFKVILQMLGPITIILGGLDSFWTILEILTWINNFYFFDINYPLNVQQFFKQIKWDDIFAIPNLIQLNQPTDIYYFQAPPKFTEKDVNPIFIVNVQIFICMIIISIIIYFLCCVVVKIFEKKLNATTLQTHKIYVYTICQKDQKIQIQDQAKKQNPDLFKQKLQKLSKLTLFLFKVTYEYKQNIQSNLFSIIDLFILDIFMASLLQIICTQNFDHYIIIINFALALISVIFILIILQVYINVSSKHPHLLNNSIYQRKYFSIYSSINYENSLSRKYCYWNIIRKAAFIFSLIYFYGKPILQTILCSISCSINQLFLLYQNPFKDKLSLIRVGIPDFCIFCITLLNVLISVDDFTQILNVQQKFNIGWVIITLISLSIFVQLLFLLKQFLFNIKSNLLGILKFFCG
ncbi:unnamed protein product [Paramecium sonneborni]|uniref:EGF-like domain-containing protein n=1 Tax=Paramecium sonneborni TaxID=65129 RepID=A0A8S1MBP0_9CILI|nr:unnamed protein product [Paramecium sonneborni]